MRVHVQVLGARELSQAIGRLNPAVRKELGQANKGIGAKAIARAYPKPESSGAGAGAKPRPSASSFQVRIAAGSGKRKSHREQWGVRWAPRSQKRAFLLRAFRDELPTIEKEYIDAIDHAAAAVGLTFHGSI
jgi:hypothetical protein